MRFTKPYTLIPRRSKCGKKIFRYRIFDPVTKKRVEISTGKRSRDAAEKFCEELRSRGALVPTSSPVQANNFKFVTTSSTHDTDTHQFSTAHVPPRTLGDFSQGMWGSECPYCQAEALRGNHVSRTYRELCATRLRKQILPTFQAVFLGEITRKMVDDWHLSMSSQPRVANTALTTLRLILGEAVRLELIPSNVATLVKPIEEKRKVRDLYTAAELGKLFDPETAQEIWGPQVIYRLACLTVSRSGMRAGEVLGLQVGSVRIADEHGWIDIKGSWDREELKCTKNGQNRQSPIPKVLAEQVVKTQSASGFVFSLDGGKTPLKYNDLRKALIGALIKIGIPRELQKQRGLGLHAFRFWLNTQLRGKISDDKIRSTIGHISSGMTDYYTSHNEESLTPLASVVSEVFR